MSKQHRPSISTQDRKLLWGKACNRCAICGRLLINCEDGDNRGSVVGVECHIIGHSNDGPRGSNKISITDKIKYENLILLCLEHAKTIDDRVDIWTIEKLIQTKSDHETKMCSPEVKDLVITPKLRLVQPVGYSGSSNGHFQTLVLHNFSTEAALDISCKLKGIGFELSLSSDVAGLYLDPGKEKEYQFQIDGKTIYTKEIKGLVFQARYKNSNDETIEYISNIIQEKVPFDASYIVKLSNSNAYEVIDNEIRIDQIIPFDRLGDYDETLYVTGINKFKIKVSGTLLSCWEFQDDEVQSCLNELAEANLQIMIKLNKFEDRDYSSFSFPDGATTGYDGFVKAISLIKTGRY